MNFSIYFVSFFGRNWEKQKNIREREKRSPAGGHDGPVLECVNELLYITCIIYYALDRLLQTHFNKKNKNQPNEIDVPCRDN